MVASLCAEAVVTTALLIRVMLVVSNETLRLQIIVVPLDLKFDFIRWLANDETQSIAQAAHYSCRAPKRGWSRRFRSPSDLRQRQNLHSRWIRSGPPIQEFAMARCPGGSTHPDESGPRRKRDPRRGRACARRRCRQRLPDENVVRTIMFQGRRHHLMDEHISYRYCGEPDCPSTRYRRR